MAKTGSPLSCNSLANSCTCSSIRSYQQNHYKYHLTWNIHGLVNGPLLSWTLCISITLIMCRDENKLGAALRNFLHCPVVSSVFTSDILLSTLPSKCTSRITRDQFSNPQKGKEKSDSSYVPISRQQMGRQNTNVNLRSSKGVERKNRRITFTKPTAV